MSLYFEIPSLQTIGKVAKFLESRAAATKQSSNGASKRNDTLVIGKDKKTPITVVRDEEYDDRFFLLVGSTESPIVRFVIGGTDLIHIVEALRQVTEDLENED